MPQALSQPLHYHNPELKLALFSQASSSVDNITSSEPSTLKDDEFLGTSWYETHTKKFLKIRNSVSHLNFTYRTV